MRSPLIQALLGMESRELENQEGVLGHDVLEGLQYGVFPKDSQLDDGGGFIRCSQRT